MQKFIIIFITIFFLANILSANNDRALCIKKYSTYYAGQGIEMDGQNYLMPVNANILEKNEVEYESLL